MNKKNAHYAIKSGDYYICVTYLPDGTPQYYETTDLKDCIFHKRSVAERIIEDLKLKNAEVVELQAAVT